MIPFYDSTGMIYMHWVPTGQTVNKEYYVYNVYNATVPNSIIVTDYLTKMGIKTVHHRPYSRDLAPCDLCLFSKLRGCRRYETSEEMKEAVTKVIDMLTQEDFHRAFQKFLEQYKYIATGGDYFEGDLSYMCVLSIKVAIRKKS